MLIHVISCIVKYFFVKENYLKIHVVSFLIIYDSKTYVLLTNI